MSIFEEWRDKIFGRDKTPSATPEEISAKYPDVPVDPVSGLPIGSLIKNRNGDFGIVQDGGKVIRISKKQARKLLREAK
jgi:hypothetical protein